MGKTVIDIQTATTTESICCGFSLLTEPPLVEGNLTADQHRVQLHVVSQCLAKEGTVNPLLQITISMIKSVFFLTILIHISAG